MSDQQDGLLVSDTNGAYFIPADQLAAYKLPDDVASTVRDAAGDEVAGFRFDPNSSKLKMDIGEFRTVDFAFTGKFGPVVGKIQYSDAPTVT